MSLLQNAHLDLERFLEYEHAVPIESPSLKTALELIKTGANVLDIGGASGILLSELLKRSNVSFHAHLLEIDEFYKERIRDARIKFIKGSILSTNQNEGFDIVLVRQVLHHLIGPGFKQTKQNQIQALQNLWKLVKPDGYLIIEETVNNNKLAARLIFYGSMIAKQLHLKIQSLEVGRVIVCYMEKEELIDAVNALEFAKIREQQFDEWHFNGLMKATNLMNNVGLLFLAIQNFKSSLT